MRVQETLFAFGLLLPLLITAIATACAVFIITTTAGATASTIPTPTPTTTTPPPVMMMMMMMMILIIMIVVIIMIMRGVWSYGHPRFTLLAVSLLVVPQNAMNCYYRPRFWFFSRQEANLLVPEMLHETNFLAKMWSQKIPAPRCNRMCQFCGLKCGLSRRIGCCSFQIYTPNSTWNIIEPKKRWFPNPESPLPRVPFSGKDTWLHQKCEVFVEFCRISSLKRHWTWRQFAVGTCAGQAQAMCGAADHGRLWHKG